MKSPIINVLLVLKKEGTNLFRELKTQMNGTKNNNTTITGSPIILEKLLSSMVVEGKEPNIMASPNAFDWDKRLMPGGSPNAFFLSLNGSEMTSTNHLFDYPAQPSPPKPHDNHGLDFLLNEVSQHSITAPQSDYSILSAGNDSNFSDSPSSMSEPAASITSLLNPLSTRREPIDRKDSHRESERRRRESFKNAMFHLENLVILTLNRAGSCKILGKGPNRKLSHCEIYQMARDIIVTLKEEIVRLEILNQDIALDLQIS